MSATQADCDTLTSRVVESEGGDVHGHLDDVKTKEVSEKRETREMGDENSQCVKIEECGQVARESYLTEVFSEVEGSKIVKNLVSEKVESRESMNENIDVNDKSVKRVGDRKKTSLENENVSSRGKSVNELLKEVKTEFSTPESYIKLSEDKMIVPQESHVLSDQSFQGCRKKMSKDGNESDDSISSRVTIILQNDCNQNRKEVSYNKSKSSAVETDCVPTNNTFAGNGPNSSSGDESHEIDKKELMVRNIDSEGISEAEVNIVNDTSVGENVNTLVRESNINNDGTVNKSQVQVSVKEQKKEQNNNYPNQQCEMKDEKDIGFDLSNRCLIVNQSHNHINSELDRVGTTSIIVEEREELKTEGEIIDCIPSCASFDVTQNNCNQSKGDEPKEIDNDLGKVSEKNTLEKVLLEIVSECGIQSTLESRNRVNHSDSPQTSVRTVPDGLEQKQTATPVKTHNTFPSLGSSPVKKCPLFQRGIFPRIVLRDSGVRTIRRLERQLFKENEKLEKRERKLEIKRTYPCESSKLKSVLMKKQDVMKKRITKNNLSTLEKRMYDNTETPTSTNDLELKCLRISLVKIDEQMLSKYNVHLPSVPSHTVVNKETNDTIPSFDEPSVSRNGTDQLSDLNTEVMPRVLNISDEQIQDRWLVHDMQDPGEHNEAKIKTVTNISRSRRNNKISVLESTADCSKENGSSLLESLASVNGSKRRIDSEEPKSSIKRQKLSTYKPKLKIARVHILKIDSSVLSKYGYDTRGIRTANTAVVAHSSTTDSSNVTSGRNEINTQKTDTNHRVNTQGPLNQPKINTRTKFPLKLDEYSSSKTNSENKFVNMKSEYTERGTMSKSIDGMNLKTASVILTDIEDVPLYRFVSLKKWPTPNVRQLMGEPKGPVKNSNNDNLKTEKVNASKIDDLPLSSRINSKKSRTLGPAKSLTRTKSIDKSECINLKTAKMIVENIEDVPDSSPAVSKNVCTESTPEPVIKAERTARMTKKASSTPSTGVVYRKKQIVFGQTKFSKEAKSAKEEAKKGGKSLCENKKTMKNYFKENWCFNGEPVHLKCARVNLFKLDSVALPKFLSSNCVVFNS